VKPPFAYYGGKTTLAPQIAALLPEHEHYVEPFAGSLAVLLAKEPSRAETVNDLDGDIVTFWRVLRDRPDELCRAAEMTPHSRAELATAWTDADDDLEQARRVWVRLTQSRGHSLKRTGWKFSRRIEAGHAAQRVASFAERMPQSAERLRGVTLENRDALDLIRDYGSEPNVCLYVDPPYLGSTRATNYRVEMLDDDAHRTFADALNECKASVVLSGYDSPLYAELFDGWHRKDLAAPTTLSGDTDRTEVLWSNRPLREPDLFDQLDSMEAELADYRAEDRRKRESAEMRRRGAGKDLACWCPLDAPCHADVLLELANEDGAP
jgi:DNA adenine methylase